MGEGSKGSGWRALAAGACAALLSFAGASAAESKISGKFGSQDVDGSYVDGAFTCTGTPTCTGTYTLKIRDAVTCSNAITLSDAFTMTGLNLSQPGSLQGTVSLAGGDYSDQRNPDGTCSIRPGTQATFNASYSGDWDGTTGNFKVRVVEDYDVFDIPGTFKLDEAPPPVFPMTVRSNIDAVSATASADIQFRPQDLGQSQSVFVFALAPATRVQGGQSAQAMRVGVASGGSKADAPVACVLAQLNAAGQMVAVTSANLQAYLTGVLTAAGASVTILNNVPTITVAGATFFVGYGSNGTTMINTGVNRSAVTVPGALTCNPQAPQAGWWWNPLEDGRGFSVEVRGNNIFFASFLYDVSGRSTWYVATGPVSLNGSYYTGPLYSARGGQTLGGAYTGRPTLSEVGTVTLSFNDANQGTMVWPGGTVPLQRFNIVTNGLTMAPVDGQPESGWWWNPLEDGRGFFLEFQGGWLDIAGYMYDDSGNSVWYLTVGQIGGTASARSFLGSWWSYGNGQTLTGAWQQNRQTSNNVAPVTINFTSSTTAVMTLPNGRTTSLTRHRF